MSFHLGLALASLVLFTASVGSFASIECVLKPDPQGYTQLLRLFRVLQLLSALAQAVPHLPCYVTCTPINCKADCMLFGDRIWATAGAWAHHAKYEQQLHAKCAVLVQRVYLRRHSVCLRSSVC